MVPPVPQDMGILDWHRHTEPMERSYRWGLDEVARLRASGNKVVADQSL
jgi:hypothetical protein